MQRPSSGRRWEGRGGAGAAPACGPAAVHTDGRILRSRCCGGWPGLPFLLPPPTPPPVPPILQRELAAANKKAEGLGRQLGEAQHKAEQHKAAAETAVAAEQRAQMGEVQGHVELNFALKWASVPCLRSNPSTNAVPNTCHKCPLFSRPANLRNCTRQLAHAKLSRCTILSLHTDANGAVLYIVS